MPESSVHTAKVLELKPVTTLARVGVKSTFSGFGRIDALGQLEGD